VFCIFVVCIAEQLVDRAPCRQFVCLTGRFGIVKPYHARVGVVPPRLERESKHINIHVYNNNMTSFGRAATDDDDH